MVRCYYHFRMIAVGLFCTMILACTALAKGAGAQDLDEIKHRGVLRHLGIPYANFVTGSGDGMDVELVKLFAKHIGVRYEFVKTDWDDVIGDLTGSKVRPKDKGIEVLAAVPIKGDLIAKGDALSDIRRTEPLT